MGLSYSKLQNITNTLSAAAVMAVVTAMELHNPGHQDHHAPGTTVAQDIGIEVSAPVQVVGGDTLTYSEANILIGSSI